MKAIIELLLLIFCLVGGWLTTNFASDTPTSNDLASAIEAITHTETIYTDTTDDVEVVSDFKTVAATFESSEIYTDFRNDTEGYSVEGFSIVDDDWVIDVICKQYDTKGLATEYWNNIAGTSEFHLENYASPNGETVNGYENDTVSYWFVDGYIYQTLYSCIDDDVVFEIYAQASTESISEADGYRMQQTVTDVLDTYQYNY